MIHFYGSTPSGNGLPNFLTLCLSPFSDISKSPRLGFYKEVHCVLPRVSVMECWWLYYIPHGRELERNGGQMQNWSLGGQGPNEIQGLISLFYNNPSQVEKTTLIPSEGCPHHDLTTIHSSSMLLAHELRGIHQTAYQLYHVQNAN